MSQLLLSTLGIVCPTCDAYNAPLSRQCAQCGTSLSGEAPLRVTGPVRPPLGGEGGMPARQPTSPALSALKPAVPAANIPPGMKPTTRGPGNSPSGQHDVVRPSPAPIPASDLVRKPPPAGSQSALAAKFVVSILSGHSAGQKFRLAAAVCHVGRSRGGILFPEDPHVSPHHATFLLKDGRLFVRDEAGPSGVFLAVQQEFMPPHSYFSAGQRLFHYAGLVEPPPVALGRPIVYGAPLPANQGVYLLEEMLVGGRAGRSVISTGTAMTIGQAMCDLTFPEDANLAVRHCELTPTPTGMMLRDLSGGMGTFVRILGERPLAGGDRLRIGDQVMQIEALP